MPIFATTKVGVSMKLLKYSYCKICNTPIPYPGRGRPKIYCNKCHKEILEERKERRRLYMVKYMSKYREKRRKMFLEG